MLAKHPRPTLLRHPARHPARHLARHLLLLLPLSLLLCAACTPESEATACTLIGCESGVTVQLATLPSAPFAVELTPAGGPSTIKECVTAEACGSELFFSGVSADSVTVTVRSAAGESTTRAKAEYAVSRPNGPQCDPECRQARVKATVPR